ncbi:MULTISPECIES: RNA polymerase sigma factor [Jeotgalibacillus]|uniref:RNA polymerase sigma factor n=1 Tax=Jeotgalibacillus TaxID=157226 RepID=UPI00106C04E0|nr:MULTISPECIES: RNA polymerase sigma factor [Jeotgalibacillus]TFD94352.1 RNA polymerase sigma factor [Jeotgalibacillus sp. R-1-5s-1]
MTDHSDEKITQIYLLHSDAVFKYIYYMVSDKHLAEDLTQETFIRVYKNLNQFRSDSTISTWMIKIARNVTLDHLKKKRFKHLLNIDLFMNTLTNKQISYGDLMIQSEDVNNLYQSLNTLKKEYKEVIILRKINECSIKETAMILEWSEDKVKSMTSRALIQLRKEFKKREASFSESFR